MCTTILFYKTIKDYPVVIGENRDAHLKSVEIPPHMTNKKPKIYSAIDKKSDGTWIGFNEYNVVVGLTNLYSKTEKIKPSDSRGKLCLDALRQKNTKELSEFLENNFDLTKYKKANIISADKDYAFLSICDKEITTIPLGRGVHVITNYDFKHKPETEEDTDLMIDSEHRGLRAIEIMKGCSIENLDEAINLLKTVFSDHKKPDYPDQGSELKRYFTICCHGDEEYLWGTRSSSIIALSEEGIEKSKYLYAGGNPCETEYKDFSSILGG